MKTSSVTETFSVTETCFWDGNFFLQQKFFAKRKTFCVTEICFCGGNFFLQRKLISVTETCFCYRNLFLLRKLIVWQNRFYIKLLLVNSKFPKLADCTICTAHHSPNLPYSEGIGSPAGAIPLVWQMLTLADKGGRGGPPPPFFWLT